MVERVRRISRAGLRGAKGQAGGLDNALLGLTWQASGLVRVDSKVPGMISSSK